MVRVYHPFILTLREVFQFHSPVRFWVANLLNHWPDDMIFGWAACVNARSSPHGAATFCEGPGCAGHQRKLSWRYWQATCFRKVSWTLAAIGCAVDVRELK